MIHFDLPKEQSSIIKVIGVGGGGSNAVNHMFNQNIDAVNFIICNTDAQAIATSNVPNKIQLGPHLTQGLGAGANPQIGREATEESLEEIKRILEVNTKMAFITAGMGGGTGTGGAPIIAKICKDLGILTVGIVTTPFAYEGKKRIAQAENGISLLKDYVDTLLVISNDKLRHQFGNLTMKAAFSKADNILATAAKCITDVINSTGQINVDFADVCTVMRSGGVAILGSAACEGENRAQKAIEDALNSPLLNDNDIRGAKWILININSSEGEHEFTMDEVETIQNYLLSQAGDDTDVILGLGYDAMLGNKIGITLIATGFEHKSPFGRKEAPQEEIKIEEKILMTLKLSDEQKKIYEQPSLKFEDELTMKDDTALRQHLAAKAPDVDIKIVETLYENLDEIAEVSAETGSEKYIPQIIHFELSSEEKKIAEKDTPTEPQKLKHTKPIIKEVTTVPTSGGYLAKPAQIYEEEQPNEKPKIAEAPTPYQIPVQAKEGIIEMELVVKNPSEAGEGIESNAQPSKPVKAATVVVEPVTNIDETEESRRRAMERIAKLRNLSFNLNATDPNNEFESIPAYLRRNMELHNSIADVESFYSNYTVKSDQNNQAEISTINTFLEGKKPD
jgi:cell division protein FtsZ